MEMRVNLKPLLNHKQHHMRRDVRPRQNLVVVSWCSLLVADTPATSAATVRLITFGGRRATQKPP